MPEPILIVDDDLSLAQAMMSVLEARGIAAEHSTRGEGAIELIRAKNYPVVVVDVVLGDTGPSGIYVVDAIRQIPSERRPLVLMVTAAGLENLRGIDRQVVLAVLLKPLDLELFAAYVKSTYDRALKDHPAEAAPEPSLVRRTPRTFCGSCGSEIPPWVNEIAALPSLVGGDEMFEAWLDTECRTCGRAPRAVGGRSDLLE